MKNKHLILSLLFILLETASSAQQFEEQTGISLPGLTQGSAAWGDYDNDGSPDIALSGTDGITPFTKIYHNNGDNTFSIAASLTGVYLGSVAWGDFDNNNYIDLLVTGTTTGYTDGAITRLYRNNGDGTFSEIPAGLPGAYFASVSWCDFDRDGRSDILITGMSDSAERICKLFRNNGSGNFTEVAGNPFLGVQYGSHSWADFDNDGYSDLIISGQNVSQERDTKLYHNNGNGTFSEIVQQTFQKVYDGSVACSDYNGDGLTDILLAGEGLTFSGITRVYKNLGNNTFSEVTGINLPGVTKCSVAWADYNDDGKPDIFLAGSSTEGRIFKIYSNCGEDLFCLSNEAIPGLENCSVNIADYDNDSGNDPDMLVTGKDLSANAVTKIYRNNCSTANSIPATPSEPTYLTSGTTAYLQWEKVTGDETPSNSLSYNVKIERSGGKPSFVPGNSTAAGLRKLTGPGNTGLRNSFIYNNLRWDTAYYASVQAIDNSFKGGPFSTPVTVKITPVQPTDLRASYISTTSIQVRWTRGNGEKCIVFAKEGSTGSASPVNNTTYYANPIFGDGSPLGSWYCVYKGEADSILISGLQTQKDYSIHVIEFQGRSGAEIYAGDVAENLAVFSTGLFTNQAGAGMTGLRYSSVSWGDFNNDRYLDALITGYNVSGAGITKIYQNNANNTFTELAGLSIPGVYHSSVAWGDYNNDGFLDILITGINDDLGNISRVYKNNGNSTFTELSSVTLTGVYNSSAAWGDYDNDGDVDIIITGLNMTAGLSTKIYRNDGNDAFTEQTGVTLPGIQNGALSLGDYDKNGFLDILLTGFTTGNIRITKIFANDGNNVFREQAGISLPGVSFSSVSWGDFDNDGWLDIALAGATGNYPNFNNLTRIYRNNGNNTFTQLETTGFTGISNGSVVWGDYNNDGYLDLLVAGHTGTELIFKIFHNNGNRTFTANPYAALPGFVTCDAKWADYDNDSDLDILIAGYTGAVTTRVYKNNSYMFSGNIRANNKPSTPAGLVSVIIPGDVSLSWNPVRGDETPETNMSYNVRCKLDGSDKWFYSPQSLENGTRSLVSIGNVQLNKSFHIKNPESGKYYWQVQAVDQGFLGSTWSAAETFLVKKTQAYFTFDTVCFGTSMNFTDKSVVFDGASSWRWDFSDGTVATVQNPVHSFAASGTFPVKLVVSGNSGTKDSLIQNVIVLSRPAASFSAPNVCIGSPTAITNTTNLHGLTASAWSWKFGDGQTSAAKDPGTHNYALSGTFKASLRAIASNGCADSITSDVIVAKYPEKAISVAGDFSTVEGKLTFCEGGSLQLNATADTLYTYHWRMDGNDLTDATASSYTVNRNSGEFAVSITNTLAACISLSDSKNINIKPAPAKPVIISDNYRSGDCIGENPVKLKIEQPVNNYAYAWLRNGTVLNNATSSFIEDFLPQGDYVAVAALNGCNANSDKFSITYQGAPEKPVVYAQGPLKWYLACNNLNASKYLWYYNGKLIDGAFSYYYVANQNLGVYQVRVGDVKGCFTTSDTIRIPMDKYAEGLKSFHNEDPFRNLKVYPNPSNGIINILMDNELYGDLEISVISQGGKEIRKLKLEKTTIHFNGSLDLTGQTRGVYLVNLRMNDSYTTNQVIIE